MKTICQCCNINISIGVACSSLGAFSLAYCADCLKHNAEPKDIVSATIESVGGLKNLAGWVKDLTYYENGEYYSVQKNTRI